MAGLSPPCGKLASLNRAIWFPEDFTDISRGAFKWNCESEYVKRRSELEFDKFHKWETYAKDRVDSYCDTFIH